MTRPRDELEQRIDTLLDEMMQLTEEQRLAFSERVARVSRQAGVSAEQAAATFGELARVLATPRAPGK